MSYIEVCDGSVFYQFHGRGKWMVRYDGEEQLYPWNALHVPTDVLRQVCEKLDVADRVAPVPSDNGEEGNDASAS